MDKINIGLIGVGNWGKNIARNLQELADSVDGNVYELISILKQRANQISVEIKEELLAGRNLLNSITVGFDRAWPSIRDGNFSTIITAVVLYWFGSNFSTSVMQGFALTLGLGVLLSMITSFQVNRILVRLITSSNLVEQSNLFIPISKRNKSGDN